MYVGCFPLGTFEHNVKRDLKLRLFHTTRLQPSQGTDSIRIYDAEDSNLTDCAPHSVARAFRKARLLLRQEALLERSVGLVALLVREGERRRLRTTNEGVDEQGARVKA
eukprot:6175329-Pleurochrysis_carterae.AAC.1